VEAVVLRAAPVVYFDFDGVIIDSAHSVHHSLDVALGSAELELVTDDELHAALGPPLPATIAALLSTRARPDLLEVLVQRFREDYAVSCIAATRLQPGIRSLLAHATVPLAIATSKPLTFTRSLLEALGIVPAFAVVAGAPLGTGIETKATTLARAMQEMADTHPNIRLGQGAMVGDRSHDIEAAVALGLQPIGAEWGYGTADELWAAGAEAVLHEPAELVPLLAPAPG
jgi:phosphoglycolate phosphatase